MVILVHINISQLVNLCSRNQPPPPMIRHSQFSILFEKKPWGVVKFTHQM